MLRRRTSGPASTSDSVATAVRPGDRARRLARVLFEVQRVGGVLDLPYAPSVVLLTSRKASWNGLRSASSSASLSRCLRKNVFGCRSSSSMLVPSSRTDRWWRCAPSSAPCAEAHGVGDRLGQPVRADDEQRDEQYQRQDLQATEILEHAASLRTPPAELFASAASVTEARLAPAPLRWYSTCTTGARRVLAHQGHQVLRVLQRVVLEPQHHVAGPQPGLLGRPAGLDAGQLHAAGGAA